MASGTATEWVQHYEIPLTIGTPNRLRAFR
jgi:hypothetical protein